MEQTIKKQYTTEDLIRGAKRDNNSKRSYLLVNPLQGKHVPVEPSQALELFDALVERVRDAVKDGYDDVLMIAFAETATAIGAAVGCSLGQGLMMQTTREEISEAEYLYFSEVHSHATAQKLVKNGLGEALGKTKTVIFIEDEVTTGNTIKNLINTMKNEYDLTDKRLMIASLLNGMEEEIEKEFEESGVDLIYLIKSDNQMYADKLNSYRYDGKCVKAQCTEIEMTVELDGRIDMRAVCDANDYSQAVERFAKEAAKFVQAQSTDRVLVLGTEEFMYPGLLTARMLKEKAALVRFHATTRSPILPSSEEDYPLQERWQLDSFYETGRITFVYNLQCYDKVVIVTDGNAVGTGAQALIGALGAAGNTDIRIVKWCNFEEK